MKNTIDRLRAFLNAGVDPLGEEMLLELEPAKKEEKEQAPSPEKVQTADAAPTRKRTNVLYAVSSIVLCCALIGILLYTVSGLPAFGGADTLKDSEVSAFYIERGLEDTGAVNIVAPIILSYRGFDTLGESHVLFIAAVCVFMLLRSVPEDKSAMLRAYEYGDDKEEPHDDLILMTGCRVIVPLILMFGVYIILNGNVSPGGGFSGGAVISAGLILYLSVYGYPAASRFMKIQTYRAVSVSALMSYSAFKAYHFITGYNGLKSIFANGTPGTIFSGGMMLYLNIFVGSVVAMTMYALFTLFRKGDF